ncbi:hypothetical protein V757_03955 [Pelistega indica]|uniref:Uracil-DNA glycosylase-like domain-containing protein n=2 Tax=Alcaligenaceae TaxID=506 RepID=V8G7Y3_9BURK|nr:hypothetical protein V757_03955 [Pelistega indica]
MNPEVPITHLQSLWIQELGISMLWGKNLTPTSAQVVTPSTTGLAKDKAMEGGAVGVIHDKADHNSVPLEQTSAVPLIKRASAENQTKSGRQHNEQSKVLSEIQSSLQKRIHQQSRRRVQENEALKDYQAPLIHAKTWDALQAELSAFYIEKQVVASEADILFGQLGDNSSKLMIIEEMPGINDVLEKQVFSGACGELLVNILQSIGLDKHNVTITSLLKYHARDEVAPERYTQLAPFLQAQIQLVQPSCIWLLGTRTAQSFLDQPQTAIETLRQQQWSFPLENRVIPVFISCHPSLALSNARLKQDIWQDLHQFYALV